MHQQFLEADAIAIDIKTPQIALISINSSPVTRNKLVALWQIDNEAKLHCQWVKQPINNNNK